MNIAQILLLTLVASIIFRTLKSLRLGKIHLMDFLFWLVFWLMVSIVIIFPSITQELANFVGIGRGADLMIYLAVLGLYFFFYSILVQLKQLDEKITNVGRQMAIIKAQDFSKPKSEN